MATKTDIRDRAASDLGILRLGQSLQDQDKVRIESAYDEVYALLKSDGLVSWPSAGTIPAGFIPHIVAMVAENCLSTYSVSPERYGRIMTAHKKAYREICKLAVAPFYSGDEETDY